MLVAHLDGSQAQVAKLDKTARREREKAVRTDAVHFG
jgi:hypothetical protein